MHETLVTRRINTKLAPSQRPALTRRLSITRWRNLANTLIGCLPPPFPPTPHVNILGRKRVDCVVREDPQVPEDHISLSLFLPVSSAAFR